MCGSPPADRGQTVENQLQPLQEAAGRLGWSIVGVFRDEGISGSLGRQKRPGLDALLKGVARREFDIVAAWSVCRLGRSLSDLIGLLGELRSRDIDLYLHQQALDTSTPSGRALFGMLGVFSEFERAMIRDRVMAGPGSRQGIWQAPGQAEDDAVQDRPYPRGAGRRARCEGDGAAAEGIGGQGVRGAAHVGDQHGRIGCRLITMTPGSLLLRKELEPHRVVGALAQPDLQTRMPGLARIGSHFFRLVLVDQLHGGIRHGIGCGQQHGIGGMDVPAGDAVRLVAEQGWRSSARCSRDRRRDWRSCGAAHAA